MSVLKPIPTEYNGVQYRSRLEARWAVFFDQLGIEYYYEYYGFQLPSEWCVRNCYFQVWVAKRTRLTTSR